MTEEEKIDQLINKGYSPSAIAMALGYATGTKQHYDLVNQLQPNRTRGCPYCGELCFGTGDCNCQED